MVVSPCTLSEIMLGLAAIVFPLLVVELPAFHCQRTYKAWKLGAIQADQATFQRIVGDTMIIR